jgi:hypothetical protein
MPRIKDAGQRKTPGQQDQRRAIGDGDLAGDKGKAPEQAEHADIKRQRIEARNRDRGGERHEDPPLPLDLGFRLAIWKLNDKL